MKRGLKALLLVLIAGLLAGTAIAQTKDDRAYCSIAEQGSDAEELQSYCAIHPGCSLVMKIAQTCVKVKAFQRKLSESQSQIAPASQSWFGSKPRLSDDQVLVEHTRSVLGPPQKPDIYSLTFLLHAPRCAGLPPQSSD